MGNGELHHKTACSSTNQQVERNVWPRMLATLRRNSKHKADGRTLSSQDNNNATRNDRSQAIQAQKSSQQERQTQQQDYQQLQKPSNQLILNVQHQLERQRQWQQRNVLQN